MCNGLREQSVASQCIGFCILAGIHIRLPGVSGGIDEKGRPFFSKKVQQEVIARIIQFIASELEEGLIALAQGLRKCLANVTASAKKYNHDGPLLSRLASAMTLSR